MDPSCINIFSDSAYQVPRRERIAGFIDRAKALPVFAERALSDLTIIERLVRAKQRGVRIRLMSLPPHVLKERKLVEGVNGLRIMDDVGIKVHSLNRLQLHAKMLLADGNVLLSDQSTSRLAVLINAAN